MMRRWWRRARWAVALLLAGWSGVSLALAALERRRVAPVERRVAQAARSVEADPRAPDWLRAAAADIAAGRTPWGTVSGRPLYRPRR